MPSPPFGRVGGTRRDPHRPVSETGLDSRPVMAGTRFTDLDAAGVLEAPRTVRVRERDYKLPGDIPAALFVRVQAIAASGDEATPEQAGAVYEELLRVFQVYQPGLESLPLGLNEMVLAIGLIYGDEETAGDVDGDGGPPTKTPTTRKPKPKRASASRKSRSSR